MQKTSIPALLIWQPLGPMYHFLVDIFKYDVCRFNVGVGVLERGGLDRLETGDDARDIILYPGTEAEKNFFE